MRLFVAVNFEDPIKDKLYEIVQNLKKYSKRGNFTRRENLHLTIVFIGQTNRLNDIKQIIDKIQAKSFDISISGFGRFKRYGGDIYWMGIEKNCML
jgi:2'-5' RNA ligase